MRTRPYPRAPWQRFSPGAGAAVVALVFSMVACASAYAGPKGTERSVAFDPPPIYWIWWDEVEECSGTRGAFGAINWYMLPAEDLEDGQEGAVGLYWVPPKAAYIPTGYLYYKGVVQHEMLHALGYRGHPIPPFGHCAPLWARVP